MVLDFVALIGLVVCFGALCYIYGRMSAINEFLKELRRRPREEGDSR